MGNDKNKICARCGGSNLVSDRSLGGRIICSQCGSYNFKTKGLIVYKNMYFLLLVLIVFLIVIVSSS